MIVKDWIHLTALMSMSQQKQDGHTLWHYIDPLTSPPANTTLRQSRLLGTVIVFVTPLAMVVILLDVFYYASLNMLPGMSVASGVGAVAGLVMGFWLNRRGHFYTAALLVIGCLCASVYLSGISDLENASLSLLDYLMLPILLSAVLLPLWGTIALVGFLLLVAITTSFVLPEYSSQIPVFFLSFVSIVVILTVHQRELIDHERQQELEESAHRFRTIFERAPLGAALLDTDFHFRRANDALCDTLGYSEDEIIGRKLSEFVYPQDSLPGITHTTNDRRLVNRDGSIRHVNFSAALIESQHETYRLLMVKDITEHQRMQEERRRSDLLRLELDRERQLRDQRVRFSATVSHELRNPLTTILSSAEMIERHHERMGKKVVTQHTDRIRAEIRSLTNMVDELLEISRSESGQVKFQPEWIDLDELCTGITQVARQNDHKQHTIRFESGGGFRHVWADANLLHHSLSNLMSNAIKYTPAGGNIFLRLKRVDDQIMICIEDTGIGIPEDSMSQLFQPFHRASNVGQIKGTGLGLAIAYDYTRKHGGTITCDSTVGKGTTFTVRIPQSQAQPASTA